MFIIIEGCDRTGKTTIANILSDRLGIPIHSFSSKAGYSYNELQAFLKHISSPMILSRFHISEMVYGTLLRNKPGINDDQFIELNRIINLKGGYIIYCFASAEEVKSRFIKDKETSVSKDLIPNILDLFSVFVNQAEKYMPVIRFGIQNYEDKQNEIDLMIDLYKNRKRMVVI